MATSKKDLEISIASITLDKTAFKGRSKRVADFRILYPRLTVAQKTFSKTLTVEDARMVKPAFDSWTDRILFKEPVQGAFGIEFSISEAVSEKDLENAAATATASLLRLLGDAASDALGLKAASGFVELPANALAKAITGSTYSAKTAAQGSLDILESDYAALKAGEERTLSFKMLAARDIVEERHRATKTQSDRVTRRTLVKADAPVGTVTLTLKAL